MRLSQTGEFGLIKKLRKKYGKISPGMRAGIGDDAAAIRSGKGDILVTTDMLIEGVHFDLSFTTFYQLGYKFLAVNISDIFAMGGMPEYFFISMGIPKGYRSEQIDELYSGISGAAKKFGVIIAGGDTCASGKGLILSGTLLGRCGRVITRGGARPGDGIYVTDTLGDSAMGLKVLKQGAGRLLKRAGHRERRSRIRVADKWLPFSDVMPLVRKHLMPEPAPLGDLTGVTSMIDISDGLLIDLDHICEESSAGAVLYKEQIPVSGELSRTAGLLNADPLGFALKGGEDYALLFTSPRDIYTGAYRIGEIVRTGRWIVDEKGKRKKFRPEGYEHFK